ncbi:hypothetical protein JW992_07305 [candidate division KSB1 bacterium]|nr:hypothetical protein [candidate division KSB1 bacterium]
MMCWFLFGLYNIVFIPLLWVGSHAAALFSPKIAQGWQGRKNLFAELERKTASLPLLQPRIWMHISSMGEFEQAKPIVALLKERHPEWIIILSFFSPSGFRPAQNYSLADVVTYLPIDSLCQSRRFIDLIKPSIALVIRHDIWLNYQWHLHRRGIPSLLVDAGIADIRLPLFKRLRFIYRHFYRYFDFILTVSEANTRRFIEIFALEDRVQTCGDTRYDQVFVRSQELESTRFLADAAIFDRRHCLVAGSTWPSDEKQILPAIDRWLLQDPQNKAIIAPHETTPEHVADLVQWAQSTGFGILRLSELDDASSITPHMRILIVDRIGLLANLYRFGSIVFVGGSFGPGIHNILEPAAHGCVLFWGPRYLNSVEAQEFVSKDLGRCVQSASEAIAWLEGNENDWPQRQKRGRLIQQMILDHTGAGKCIVERIERILGRSPQ